jgi:hypothetical protein
MNVRVGKSYVGRFAYVVSEPGHNLLHRLLRLDAIKAWD